MLTQCRVSAVSAPDVEGIEGIGSVSAAQGEEWIDLLSSGVNVTVNIVDPEVADQFLTSTPNTRTGGCKCAGHRPLEDDLGQLRLGAIR